MAFGPGLNAELKWDPNRRGFVATGPYDWRGCVAVTIYVTQQNGANAVVAEAHGAPVLYTASSGDKIWELAEALRPLAGYPELENAPAHAVGAAVMVDADGITTEGVQWKADVTLVGKP